MCSDGSPVDENGECVDESGGMGGNGGEGGHMGGCDTMECPDNSTCDDSSGSPTCVCSDGSPVDENGECVDESGGMGGNGGEGGYIGGCDTMECPDNSTCDDSSGSPTCVCSDGSPVDENGECVDESGGMGGNGGEGGHMGGCDTMECPVNSTCDASSGSASCVCNNGFVENGNGGCIADGGTSGNGGAGGYMGGCGTMSCPSNSTCDDSNGSPTCVCNDGFIENGNGVCINESGGMGTGCIFCDGASTDPICGGTFDCADFTVSQKQTHCAQLAGNPGCAEVYEAFSVCCM